MKHAAELNARRTQLTTSNGGLDHSRWLQDVEALIDEVIETSGGHVKNSPELLRAVRWMTGSATAQLASPSVPSLFDTKIGRCCGRGLVGSGYRQNGLPQHSHETKVSQLRPKLYAHGRIAHCRLYGSGVTFPAHFQRNI